MGDVYMNYNRIFKFIAFGFILIVFHITINEFDLLPNWLGYLLIYQALKESNLTLFKQSRLDILLIIFVVYNLFTWILPINNIIINILLNITSVIVNYLILSCIIELCELINSEVDTMINYRKIQLILDIICTVGIICSAVFLNELIAFVALFVGISLIILRVIIIIKCFNLSKISEI